MLIWALYHARGMDNHDLDVPNLRQWIHLSLLYVYKSVSAFLPSVSLVLFDTLALCVYLERSSLTTVQCLASGLERRCAA